MQQICIACPFEDIEPLDIKNSTEYSEAIKKRDELIEESEDIDRVLYHIITGIEKYEKANYEDSFIAKTWKRLADRK